MSQMVAKKYLLAEQTISPEELCEVADWLRTNPWLTQGPLVKEFEREWAQWQGTKHALFVNSGSSANLLMYYAPLVAGRLRNLKIIVPAVSWATTVAPAIQLGFEPIMCEADPETLGLDLNHLSDLLVRHEPAAIIMVHVLGCPNKMEDIMSLKARHGFLLMEDCCASHGSLYDGQKVGTFGEISTFSFYYGHHMSTVEGGTVCTNDDELQDILLQIRSHGWAKDIVREKEAAMAKESGAIEFNRMFTFYQPGFNFRATDLNAKIGLLQLPRLDGMSERRVANHRTYQSCISGTPGFSCQTNPRAVMSSISFACLTSSSQHRERVAQALRGNGIETRPIGGGNMSRQPFWFKRFGSTSFPIADRIHECGMQLPNHHLLDQKDIEFICKTVTGVAPT